MERPSQKNTEPQKTRKNLIVLCCILLGVLIALIFVMLGLKGNDEPQATGPSSTTANTVQTKELLVEQIEELGDTVIVTTSYGVIKYPFAFSDLIRIETETHDGYAQMDFSAVVGDEEVLLYTVFFNKHTGIPIGTLMMDGTAYAVTAVIYELSDVNEEYRLTYQAAQETFNEVMMSLEENTGFTAAQ